MNLPTGYPTWAASAGSSGIVLPTTHLNTGWLGAVKPRAQYQNWWQHLANSWIRYLNDRAMFYENWLVPVGPTGASGPVAINRMWWQTSTGASSHLRTIPPVGSGYPGVYMRVDLYTGTSGVMAQLSSAQQVANPAIVSSLYSLQADVTLSHNGANRGTVRFGLANARDTDLATHFALFSKLHGETNWQCTTSGGAGTVSTDSGVVASIEDGSSASQYQRLRIELYGSSLSSNRARFYINDTLVVTQTTNLPGAQLYIVADVKRDTGFQVLQYLNLGSLIFHANVNPST